jgi:hypothetical protein
VNSEKEKILIIIGAAPCVREDIGSALLLAADKNKIVFADYILIGLDSVDVWPCVDAQYFATYHPSEIEMAKERRAKAGGNTDYMVISHQQHPETATGRDLVDLIIPCEPPSGSSALLGVLAGIQLGYEKIIICGCPLTGTNDKGYDYANFRVGWTAKLNEIKDKTRAMSGFTKELLLPPDVAWLEK